MTKQNPFEKFWAKWDKRYMYDHKEFGEFEQFKAEFSALCETHAKQSEKEGQKNWALAEKYLQIPDDSDDQDFFADYVGKRKETDAFRLVKPKQQKTWQEELDDSMRKAFQKQRNRKIIDSITMKKEKKQQ